MQPRSAAAKRERLEVYLLKAEEAENKANTVEDLKVREIWAQIAQARRALVSRVSDDLERAGCVPDEIKESASFELRDGFVIASVALLPFVV